jgi:hypothetical protein
MQPASRQSKYKFYTQVRIGKNRKGGKVCVEYAAFAGNGNLQTVKKLSKSKNAFVEIGRGMYLLFSFHYCELLTKSVV